MQNHTADNSNHDLQPWLKDRSFADWRRQFDTEGFLVFENVLTEQEVARYREALKPWLKQNRTGRNNFEGLKSNRIYAMLAKSPLIAELIVHPLALAFAEADLGHSCLLSACLAINLHPGESVQPWHYDDAHISIPLPRPSYGVSAFWAIDETNEHNGATEILPGSHQWTLNKIDGSLKDEDFNNRATPDANSDPGAHPDAMKISLPAGSLMITKGTLWHRGGANKSGGSRLIITPQYCPGWARQLENMIAAVPPAIALALPQRARELIGYSIHPPFMGYVDGVHPEKSLLPFST